MCMYKYNFDSLFAFMFTFEIYVHLKIIRKDDWMNDRDHKEPTNDQQCKVF